MWSDSFADRRQGGGGLEKSEGGIAAALVQSIEPYVAEFA
jgi:hypothetical protein